MPLKAIYLAGYPTAENMKNPNYLNIWQKAAQDAEAKDMGLVVFKVPNNLWGNPDPDTIAEIEKLLQDTYGDKL